MVSVMRVDIAPLKHFLYIAAGAVLLLVISIIIGATGPREFDSTTIYAYNCPGNNHTFNEYKCGGEQLSDNSSVWYVTVPPLTALNRFWSFQITVFTQQSGNVQRNLQVNIEVYGKNEVDLQKPYNLVYARNTTQNVICSGGPGECDPLVIVDNQDLRYSYYSVAIRIFNGGQEPNDSAPFVGDVRGVIWVGHSGYSSLELALRIIFLAVNSCLLVVFLWWLRSIALEDWAWEQRALIVLLLAAIALNNPLYGIQYASRGWFFHFLDALFTIIYLSVFLLFGLLILDKIRLEDVRMQIGKQHIPKYLVVGTFFVLGVVLFAWVDIRDDFDPILGHRSLLNGVQVLFYIVSAIFCGILVWLAVLVVMTVPVATAKPYLKTRFLFVAIPTSYCVISILIGIFNGTFGPLNESTLSMVYFLTMYNMYVWVLTVGFWPIRERFTARNPSEADTIVRFESSYS